MTVIAPQWQLERIEVSVVAAILSCVVQLAVCERWLVLID